MKLFLLKLLFAFLCFISLLIVLDILLNPKISQPNTRKQYGFTTHLYVTKKTHLDRARFEKTVDELVSHNQKLVRVDIQSWEIAPHGSPTQIAWNYHAADEYKKALQYAHEKGLDVYLVTYPPSFAKNYSHTDYKNVTHLYYQFLAQTYGEHVLIWQIFNEPDFFRYTDYSPLPIKDYLVPWSSEYTENIGDILEIARTNIKAVSPNALITTNVGGYMNEESIIRWRVFFNATAKYMDIIAIDIYPTTLQEVTTIPMVIEELRKTYHKPIIISELGYCKSEEKITTDEQRVYYLQSMRILKNLPIWGLIIYQYIDSDDAPAASSCKGSGIIYADGTKKDIYDEVIKELQK